ncbi:MarC family protein [Usitatibacter palustris]|uniref:UPF0056 membrane protein n=1 Tax=Usitatibacter palustris TaxID=2732487 RepID=A0A6M4H7J7_9PROT|nr:MarC family protein [Usitatibacter palustris]QJR14344.1 hypothetical protein DSM104440_01140 [Usitatibacter palustris]
MEFDFALVLKTALLAIGALLPITNPPGAAPVFMRFTSGLEEPLRVAMARSVAMNCFFLLVASAFVGVYVLAYFGISLSVVRVGGGLLVAATAWRMLTADEGSDDAQKPAPRRVSPEKIRGHAFYPLAFPLIVGPGSIATAITIGTTLPRHDVAAIWAGIGLVLGLAGVALAIYLANRYAPRLMRLLGDTGTAVFLQLMAFILLCIGVQIVWDGVSELLKPWRPGH